MIQTKYYQRCIINALALGSWFGLSWAALAAVSTTNGLTHHQHQLEIDSFEQAWSTLRDYHYDPAFGGMDWQAVHDELSPQLNATTTRKQASRILQDLAQRLKQSHIMILPREIRTSIGRNAEASDSVGETGIAARPISRHALVIRVESESPAGRAGIKPGWELLHVGAYDVRRELAKLADSLKDNVHRDLVLATELNNALRGKVGASKSLQFANDTGQILTVSLALAEPKGSKFQLGDSLLHSVWMETRTLPGNIGYIAFNAFLDPARLMPTFNNAMTCYITNQFKGIVLDLRGNSGGLGMMVTGMAGWFLKSKGADLGTLILRSNQLKFAVSPRPKTYQGHVAVLQDSLSLCASEVLGLGLREHINARIFGSRTAGVAQSGQIVNLPNGDLFLYAVADFKSSKGHRLEGDGVTPDVKIEHTKESLLAGRDVVLESAIQWINSQNSKKNNHE